MQWRIYRSIGQEVGVFTNDPGDRGPISGRIIPKTQKMVSDASFPNTQLYKLRVKGKVEQSRERSSTFPLHLCVVAIEKGAFGLHSILVTKFTSTLQMVGNYHYLNNCGISILKLTSTSHIDEDNIGFDRFNQILCDIRSLFVKYFQIHFSQEEKILSKYVIEDNV